MNTQLPGAGAILGGDFRIERQLGAGGMGAVYVAEQLSTGRRRALKLMHPSLVSDAKLRERFEQEARVGAKIPSDHVVQVIAAGVDEGAGTPFIAMELLDGEDLAATVARQGALPASDVSAILEPVCHALGAAHGAGIVHRDLKPENIFLLHTHGVQRSFDVKLLDFGIAKLTAEARTMATSAVGTPLWMAPEQTDPRAKIAPTADVWPLGLLVFTMLTGRSYWRVANDPGVSIPALMREILFEPLVPASVRAVELGIETPLPAELDVWFRRCLERDPTQRFPSAKEAWEALVPVLGSESKPPAELAAIAAARGGSSDRARLEMAATAPVMGSVEMAATVPAPSLLGAPGGDEKQVAIASTGNSTGLSVGQTVPAVAPPGRSKLRTFGGMAVAAMIAVGSWQFATFRAERKLTAVQEKASTQSLPMESAAADQPLPAASVLAPDVMPSAGASAMPDAPLPKEVPSAAATAATRPKPAVVPAKPVSVPVPFDAVVAQRSVDNLAGGVKHICGRLPGPRAFSITVVFDPSGRPSGTRASGSQVAMPTVNCAKGVLMGARVPPYDASFGNGTAAAGISLD
ncbi:MAG: protein kinase [Polyangiaceae bacterium]|nr:protein kinase [Polyangiaceae bacterium]